MNKNSKRSIELYKTLTPKQQAAILFECIGDAEEAAKVRDSVEVRSYRLPHAVFTDWRDFMNRMGWVTASEYWRLNFLMASSVARFMADTTTDGVDRYRGELTALLQSVKTFSEENGFSYEAVLASGNVSLAANEELEPYNPDTYQAWLECWNSIMPKYEAHQNIHNLARGKNP